MQIFELKNISDNSLGRLKNRMEMIDKLMIFKTDQQKLSEKQCKKFETNEPSLSGLWDNINKSNICVTKIIEEEKKGIDVRKKISWKKNG